MSTDPPLDPIACDHRWTYRLGGYSCTRCGALPHAVDPYQRPASLLAPLDLAAIRRVYEEATPGLWEHSHATSLSLAEAAGTRTIDVPHHVRVVDRDTRGRRRTRFVADCPSANGEADARFVALASTALPQLLALVEEAKSIIDTLAEYCCSAAPYQDHDELMAWTNAWLAKTKVCGA